MSIPVTLPASPPRLTSTFMTSPQSVGVRGRLWIREPEIDLESVSVNSSCASPPPMVFTALSIRPSGATGLSCLAGRLRSK
ncbi:hypothetical protein DPEC_G00320030 [Dallia pectoralis]|uniref:Uncharacterized protein n=1 Tax=Dallia pectoralis TaxID=75939 RepID=A0ACC2F9P2_DALPE|nr:hypothetical protein DPEC_G00320030 [Dallia pectoralis]